MPAVAGRFTPEFRHSPVTAVEDRGKLGDDGVSPFGGRLYPKIVHELDKVKALVSDASPLFSREHIRNDLRVEEVSAGGENGGSDDAEGERAEQSLLAKGIHVAEKLISSKFRSLFLSTEPHKAERLQAVSWHRRNLWLAFVGREDQVLIQDFEDPNFREPTILSAETQKGVEAIEWRPNAGATLSVGCRGGICIWTASYPGTIAPVRTGNLSYSGTLTGGSGARWVLVDFLRQNPRISVTSLSWSPCGRLLASASVQEAAFTVWDVSLGQSTPLRRGLGGVSLLKWAPSGGYVVSSKVSGAFHLWETYTWTSQPWTTSQGSLANAVWSPDGRVLLAAFDQSPSLAAFHFAARPPSLDVHWLPVELPGLSAVSGGCCCIDKMAWDNSGKRLAVSCTPSEVHTYSGRVAIYDVRQAPLVSASLLGVVSPGEPGARPVAFAFHATKTQGTLFSVCWSNGFCCIYSLLFGS